MDDIVKRIRQQSYFGTEPYEAANEIEQLRQRVQELEELLKESYKDADEVLRPRVAELEKEQQWQPIETAPKDTFVLLAGPSGYATIETVFATGRMCSDYHKGRWIDHANDDLTDWGFVPTHWMPLPYVPAIATVKEK